MVHTFQCLGVNIAVDVYSGAVHILDKTAYDVLNLLEDGVPDGACPQWVFDRLEGCGREAVQTAWSELREL